MNKSNKFTPGPWVQSSVDKKSILALSNKGTFMKIAESLEVRFADGTGTHSVDLEEALKNAKLMSAAPEMLEAIQAYMAVIQNDSLESLELIEERMLSALAKATGGAE